MYVLKRLAGLLSVLALCVIALPSVNAEQAIEVYSRAASAVLYEPSSGRVLFEQQAHVKRPMASTTKLMTALLAVEQLPPDAVLTATEQALAVEGSSLGLHVGDTVSRDDLLYGLLLSSGNDAANVFALSMADSMEAFALMMNERARSLGMHNSCFVTPSGLDAEGHGASAYDMALLTAEVLKNELLATICASQSATVTLGERTVSLSNHNRLLSMYDGAVGMKTGYTSKAGRCLVSAATRDGVTLIAVTLDCSDDWEEHTALLDAGFSRLVSVSLEPATPLTVRVFGAESTALSLQAVPETVTVMQGDSEAITAVYALPPYVWAPITEGDTIGSVTYLLRGAQLAEVTVTARETIAPCASDSWWDRTIRLFRRLLEQALT